MIHKQYNEIMANSKKKFSNLYSDRLPIVMHLNNNKQDCRAKNLKCGTNLENTLQAWFDGCLPTPNKIIYFNDVHHLHNQGLSNLEIANILPNSCFFCEKNLKW